MAGADFVNLSWLNQPNPVDSYAHGLQIGTQIGSEQARQQLAQQQMLQQQQEQQVKQAHDAAVFQLQSQAQARKFAAQQKFDSLVQSGIDPAKALLQVAPDLGESLTGAAQLYKASQPAQMSPYQTAELAQRKADLEEKKREFDVKQPTPDEVFQQGPVQGQPVLDPTSKQPIPGLVAIPSASGKGVTVHLTPKAEEDITPDKALKFLDTMYSSGSVKKIDPEGTLTKELQDVVKRGFSKLQKTESKPTTAKDKVAKANELAKKHPDWTKKQVIDSVNSGVE